MLLYFNDGTVTPLTGAHFSFSPVVEATKQEILRLI
jgi:hypothetical protein